MSHAEGLEDARNLVIEPVQLDEAAEGLTAVEVCNRDVRGERARHRKPCRLESSHFNRHLLRGHEAGDMVQARLSGREHIAIDGRPRVILGNELHLGGAGLPEGVMDRRLARLAPVGEIATHVVPAHEERTGTHHLDPVANGVIEIGDDECVLNDRIPNEGRSHSRTVPHAVLDRRMTAQSQCSPMTKGPPIR